MDDKNKNRCGHTGCSCLAAKDSKYCSPHCETVKTGAEISCECGHPQCTGKID
jgi:hypothetical protein